MAERQGYQFKRVWNQRVIPVVFKRPRPSPLLVRLPYAKNNYQWLCSERRRTPRWSSSDKQWEVPVAWFDDLIKRLLERYGHVYVVQLHKQLQKCAPACWNAKGIDCECSCMGANHGIGHPGDAWHEVSDTFAFSWDAQWYACRLLVKKPQ